mmetsp:Transcript_13713/g.41751  ORF Transcript_13713/g.41751 Transcript_13713/m.41751 type:complete len:215 (+) Transcript_13713:1509-2153(+)
MASRSTFKALASISEALASATASLTRYGDEASAARTYELGMGPMDSAVPPLRKAITFLVKCSPSASVGSPRSSAFLFISARKRAASFSFSFFCRSWRFSASPSSARARCCSGGMASNTLRTFSSVISSPPMCFSRALIKHASSSSLVRLSSSSTCCGSSGCRGSAFFFSTVAGRRRSSGGCSAASPRGFARPPLLPLPISPSLPHPLSLSPFTL